MTKILAHRGANTFAPENTIEAFRIAIEQGADGLELDVHLSKDGEVMVFHDLTLARMTGQPGRICDFTCAQLQALDFPIPTLREVYALVNRPMVVNVELKTYEELYPALTEKLINLENELKNDFTEIIYSSFNHYSLQALRQCKPDAKIGLLYHLPLVDPHVYASYLKADALHAPWKILAALPKTVSDCHEKGIAVNVWTVNEPEIIKQMKGLNVDAIITDVPHLAQTL